MLNTKTSPTKAVTQLSTAPEAKHAPSVAPEIKSGEAFLEQSTPENYLAFIKEYDKLTETAKRACILKLLNKVNFFKQTSFKVKGAQGIILAMGVEDGFIKFQGEDLETTKKRAKTYYTSDLRLEYPQTDVIAFAICRYFVRMALKCESPDERANHKDEAQRFLGMIKNSKLLEAATPLVSSVHIPVVEYKEEDLVRKYAAQIEYFINKYPKLTWYIAKGRATHEVLHGVRQSAPLFLISFPPELGHTFHDSYLFMSNPYERLFQLRSPGFKRKFMFDCPGETPFHDCAQTDNWSELVYHVDPKQDECLPKSDFCHKFEYTVINLSLVPHPLPAVKITRKHTEVLSISSEQAQKEMQSFFAEFEANFKKIMEGVDKFIASAEARTPTKDEIHAAKEFLTFNKKYVIEYTGIKGYEVQEIKIADDEESYDLHLTPEEGASRRKQRATKHENMIYPVPAINILAYADAWNKMMEQCKAEMVRQRQMLVVEPNLKLIGDADKHPPPQQSAGLR